jgi:Nickel/cobalt transporter regulator
MRRLFVSVAIFALALPTLATAQPFEPHHPPGPRPGPHGPVGPMVHYGPRNPFVFHGHPIHHIRFARPWVWPHGYAYQRWVIGSVLPPVFVASTYYYANWAAVGLSPPSPGYQWIQYGPDLLLVELATGRVVDVAYDVFY